MTKTLQELFKEGFFDGGNIVQIKDKGDFGQVLQTHISCGRKHATTLNHSYVEGVQRFLTEDEYTRDGMSVHFNEFYVEHFDGFNPYDRLSDELKRRGMLVIIINEDDYIGYDANIVISNISSDVSGRKIRFKVEKDTYTEEVSGNYTYTRTNRRADVQYVTDDVEHTMEYHIELKKDEIKKAKKGRERDGDELYFAITPHKRRLFPEEFPDFEYRPSFTYDERMELHVKIRENVHKIHEVDKYPSMYVFRLKIVANYLLGTMGDDNFELFDELYNSRDNIKAYYKSLKDELEAKGVSMKWMDEYMERV